MSHVKKDVVFELFEASHNTKSPKNGQTTFFINIPIEVVTFFYDTSTRSWQLLVTLPPPMWFGTFGGVQHFSYSIFFKVYHFYI